MYTSILVPLDGSAFADRALPVALALAHRSQARVILVHVVEPGFSPSEASVSGSPLDSELGAGLHQSLAALAKLLEARHEIDIDFICLEGPVARRLEEYACSSGAELIVMSTHGQGGLSRAWLGSVADHLVRHSPVPVLLVRPGAIGTAQGEPLFRRILVPLDGSKLSEAALEHAVTLATPGETEFTLLRVVVPQPIAHLYPARDALMRQEDREREEREAEGYLGRLCEEFAESGFAVTGKVLIHRNVARGILDHARDHQTDMIALATRGRGGVARLLLGSVADKLLRGARTPLLIYHPPQTEGAGNRAVRREETATLGAPPAASTVG